MSAEKEPRRRIELNGLQVAAATAAAVTATVVASTLGVAGTIIGAVLASVISTVGSALYLASMNRTKEKLRSSAALSKAFGTVDITAVDGRTKVVTEAHTAVLAGSEPKTHPATYAGRATVTAPTEPGPPDTTGKKRSWKTVAATAAIVCLLTFGVITIAEALLGHPLANLFGGDGSTGTTLNHHPPSDTDPTEENDNPAPVTSDSPTPESSITPSQPEDTPTPTPTTPSPSPSSSSPSSSPSPTPPADEGEVPDA